MKSFFVLHVDDEIVHDVIDGVLYSVPPGEPYEFANPFFGRKFIEHKWFHGVVEVQLQRTKAGWTFLLEDAYERAKAALEAADGAYNSAYIETQQQDRLMRGVPASPPSARQKRILQRQAVNLEEYGIKPIGTKSNQDKMLEAVVEQNKTMMSLIAALVTGSQIKPADLFQTAKSVCEPVHESMDGRQVLVPPKPRDMTVAHVAEHPEPIHREVRLYNEGEELDTSELGPEFAGDVNDPNQIPGPKMPGSDDPVNLNDIGIAPALNMDETRVKLRVPAPPKPGKTKVNIQG